MAFLPHPAISLTQIRTTDIWLMLAVGALWEALCRTLLLLVRKKSPSFIKQQAMVEKLEKNVQQKRKLGPGSFVETSKLERQLLAEEKTLTNMQTKRKQSAEALERLLLRHGNMILAFFIFILYYGVPLLTIDHLEIELATFLDASTYFKTLLFPLSLVGMGMKISRLGFGDVAQSSVGALVALWSAQVTVGKLFDAADAYFV